MALTEEEVNKIENQIKNEQQSISYDIKDFTIEYYVQKYLDKEEIDENELYVPGYQREFIWESARQSKFIESVILGLPIPLIFVAEIEEDESRLEIVDGSQRIRTLAAFINNELKLTRLEKLTEINGLYYKDLKPSRQRLFKNSSMRMIVLSSRANEDIRNDMFGRINTSSVPLLAMETRRGIYRGDFMDFITELAKEPLFKKLCPIDSHFAERREEEELILRFFAFSEGYPSFNMNGVDLKDGSVAKFIDKYLEKQNLQFSTSEKEIKRNDFMSMLEFVQRVFGNKGFGKHGNSQATSRPYFEAIALGSHFAEKSGKKINAGDLSWATLDKRNPNKFFHLLSARYHTHKPKTIRERIEFVINNLTS